MSNITLYSILVYGMLLIIITLYSCSDLSYNELSGSFPSWVGEQNLQLYASNGSILYFVS